MNCERLVALDGTAPDMHSAIRSRPVGAAIRLNPQSALPNVQTCIKRWELSGQNAHSQYAANSTRKSLADLNTQRWFGAPPVLAAPIAKPTRNSPR
eukprot:6120983-Alexandrium_andersonii.AAC.1